MSKFYYASLAVSGISADQWRTPEARLSRWGASYDRPGYATTLVSDSELEKDSPVVAIGWNGDLTVYVIIGSANVPAKADGLPQVVSGGLDLSSYDKAQADIKRRIELKAALDSQAAQWAELEKYAKLADADPSAKAKVKELAGLMGLTFPAK